MYIDFSKVAKTLKVFGTTMAPPLIDFIITLSNLREESLRVYCGKYSYYDYCVSFKDLNSTFLVVGGRTIMIKIIPSIKLIKSLLICIIYSFFHFC